MFVHDAVGVDKGFSYSRVSNPTVAALEEVIGALEGTPAAVCFKTGMAAESTLFLSLLKAGDHAIISEVVYGGTVRLFRELLDGLGVHASFVDASVAENVEAAITPTTRLIFIETPGNARHRTRPDTDLGWNRRH
jgi:O-acetylhomoserine/O-acetylserine sulfhydrylase-like pyridoxal-dependent enzyme